MRPLGMRSGSVDPTVKHSRDGSAAVTNYCCPVAAVVPAPELSLLRRVVVQLLRPVKRADAVLQWHPR